jgi:hypothetical protein
MHPFPPVWRVSRESNEPRAGPRGFYPAHPCEARIPSISEPSNARLTLPPHSCRARRSRRRRRVVRSAGEPHTAARPLPPRDSAAAGGGREFGAVCRALPGVRRSRFLKMMALRFPGRATHGGPRPWAPLRFLYPALAERFSPCGSSGIGEVCHPNRFGCERTAATASLAIFRFTAFPPRPSGCTSNDARELTN